MFLHFVFAGEKLSKTFPDGTIVEVTLTSSNKPEKITSSDGSIYNTFTYDEQDRIISGTTPETCFVITYDEKGDPIEEKWHTGFTFYRTFDQQHCITSYRLPEDREIVFTYDNDRTFSISYGGYTRVFNSYNSTNDLLLETLPADLGQISYDYNENRLQTSITCPFLKQTRTYSEQGLLTNISTNDHAISYEYDWQGQLIQESEISYDFDCDYRFLNIGGSPIRVNENGQVEEIGEIKCTYDKNGRLVQKQTPSDTIYFSYDALSQLIQIETQSQRFHFIYDALGRRVTKIIYSPCEDGWQETNRENYLYEWIWEIASYTPDLQIKELRVYHPDNILKTVFIETNGQITFPVTNQLGHTLCLIKPNGEIQYSSPFTTFGQFSGPLLHPWSFSGHRFDPESNLYYFGKRYYDPMLLTWITPDPLGPVQSTNLYQFLFNNPLMYTDLDGLWTLAPALSLGIKEILKAAAQLVIDGIASAIGLKTLTENPAEIQKEPPYNGKDLGENPAQCPAEGFEWKCDPESGIGSWYNPSTQESLYPDLNHPAPMKPHWDYKGKGGRARLNTDGTYEWKK